jgi:hypothetical protein
MFVIQREYFDVKIIRKKYLIFFFLTNFQKGQIFHAEFRY